MLFDRRSYGGFCKSGDFLDDALDIVRSRNIVYAPDATMQSMLSDKSGRVLMIEPGIGYRLEKKKGILS